MQVRGSNYSVLDSWLLLATYNIKTRGNNYFVLDSFVLDIVFTLQTLLTSEITDGRTDLHFLAIPRHIDYNGIQHSVVAWINTDHQQNNTSPK